MRPAGFALLVVLSLGVAGYAMGVYGFLPLGAAVHPDMRATFVAHRAGIYVHVFASAVALVLGPLQFSTRLRTARPGLHRWSGRFYLGVGILLGGLAGLFMAFHAAGGRGSRPVSRAWPSRGCSPGSARTGPFVPATLRCIVAG